MIFYRSMRVATRLSLGFGALTLLGIAIALFGTLKIHALNQQLNEVANDRIVKTNQFADYRQNISAIASTAHVLLMAEETLVRDAKKKKIDAIEADNNRLLALLDATLAMPKSIALLTILKETGTRYHRDIADIIELANRGEALAGRQRLEDSGRSLQETLFKAIDDSMNLQQSHASALAKVASQEARNTMVLLLGLALSMLVIGSAVGFALTRHLSSSLGAEPDELCEVMRRVAGGDLSVALSLPEGDSTSVLAAVHRMQMSLTLVVNAVRVGSLGVARTTGRIAHDNYDLSGRIETQASTLQEAAASMEQLGSTVKQNADNAIEANQLALNASTAAINGGEVVAQVAGTMKGIVDASARIADITQVMDGIAFQTNILALNAAVEAARAGEQGRGFAVVATEVRLLAGRSADAAKEIKHLINASVERVKQGSTLVDQAGSTLLEVVRSIGSVTVIMGEISAASTAQSRDIAQVGEAVALMDEATQHNAMLVEEVATAASRMQSEALDLVQTVALFSLPEGEEYGVTEGTAPVPVFELWG